MRPVSLGVDVFRVTPGWLAVLPTRAPALRGCEQTYDIGQPRLSRVNQFQLGEPTRPNMLHCHGSLLQGCTSVAQMHNFRIGEGFYHTSSCADGTACKRFWHVLMREDEVHKAC